MPRAINITAKDALEVVRLFHAEYDRTMRQDLALGLLLIAARFKQPALIAMTSCCASARKCAA